MLDNCPEENAEASGIEGLFPTQDTEIRLEKIAQYITKMLKADICAITFLENSQLIIKTVYSDDSELANRVLSVTELPPNAPCFQAIQTHSSIILNNVLNDENGKYAFLNEKHGWNSFICVPMITPKGKILGTISCYSVQPEKFTQDNIEFLYIWSKWAGIGLLEHIAEKEILTIQQEATEKTKQLTEQIQLTQKQLIQSEKLSIIGQLIAGIAHELNNPLTTISGFSQLALEQKKPEKNMSYLEKIHAEAMRCERIVKQLLIFARKHISEKSYVNINAIIQSIVNLKNYEWKVNKIEVTLDLDKKLHPTMADEFQLQQALLNIVLNAEQALNGFNQSGKLLIETSQQGSDILIKITDNGPGIPPEMHKTIFEPFFTTKPIGEGTGLGLSLCTNIVKDHNGEISMESTPGKGATFIIKLPIAPKTDTSEIRKKRKSEHINRNIKGKKVIVIDDEIHITELMREILSQSGIIVATAYDGNSGLEKLKKEKYDMVICDIKMPAFSGIELHYELAKINPKLAREVLYLTGDIFSKETQEFINKTGVQTLQKPFNITEFKNIVLSHLSTH